MEVLVYLPLYFSYCLVFYFLNIVLSGLIRFQ